MNWLCFEMEGNVWTLYSLFFWQYKAILLWIESKFIHFFLQLDWPPSLLWVIPDWAVTIYPLHITTESQIVEHILYKGNHGYMQIKLIKNITTIKKKIKCFTKIKHPGNQKLIYHLCQLTTFKMDLKWTLTSVLFHKSWF